MDNALNSPPNAAQPHRAIKARKSNKAPLLQTAVIAKYSSGESKSSIANDLGMHRNTVASILADSEIQQIVLQGRSRAISLIPRSLDVCEYRLNKNDGNVALSILRGTQVLVNQQLAGNTTNNFAIMLSQLKQADEPEIKPAIECPPRDTQADIIKP